jgi:hypothetical protein
MIKSLHKKIGLGACLLALLSGCDPLRELERTTPAPTSTESIFIMGVAPENYRVAIFPGSIKNGVFSQNVFGGAAFYGAAKDGYIVGKSSGGDVLGVTTVRIVKDADSVIGTSFKPCNGAKTMVFETPKGKVIYLGDAEYTFSGNKIEVRYSQNIDSARAYLDKNFPALRDKLEYLPFELLPARVSCDVGPIYLPLYIPRSK